jgi:hypothetical protein
MLRGQMTALERNRATRVESRDRQLRAPWAPPEVTTTEPP